MALNKDVELDSGVTASYHRITNICHRLDGNMVVTIESYKDKDARDALKRILSSQIILISKDNIDLTNALLSQLYDQLKSTPQFSGALDA